MNKRSSHASECDDFCEARRHFRWPGGRHVATIVNVAYEAWSDGKGPGIGPMANPLPSGVFDTNALSWGNYSRFDGLYRILRILDRRQVCAGVIVSGILAERAASNLRAIFDVGHVIIARSYAQDIVPASLSLEQDRSKIERTTTLIESAISQRPRGWASPRSTPSEHAIKLLIDAGYAWHTEVLDADAPYEQAFENRRIVAIPFSKDINDLPHAMKYGRSPRRFVEMFDDLIEHSASSDDGAIIIDVTADPHCYGRPDAAWAYEEVIRKITQRDDIWLATRAEAVEHFLKTR